MLAGAVLALTGAAHAQEAKAPAAQAPASKAPIARTVPSSSDDRDYGYVFGDDPMQAGVMGPNDARVRVMDHPLQQLLIRPRTAFVGQMLRSVEGI